MGSDGIDREALSHQVSKKTLKEVPPKFSDRTFKELVNIAFKDRIVESLDHEIWEVAGERQRK